MFRKYYTDNHDQGKKMKYSKSISIFALLLLTGIQSFACTVFMYSDGRSTLVGSNEDFKRRDSQVWFIPARDGRYGYALFGYDGSVQAGINEKGLFWDGLRAYPYTKAGNIYERLDIGGNILHKISEECATVDDVISLFEKYYWEGFRVAQLMVVDKTGESAIITYYNNELTVTKNAGNHQVCTNFRITCNEDSENYHWYNIGSKRFRKAEKMINMQEMTVDNFFSILDATHQNNPIATTIYSTVCDLSSRDIYISVNGDFGQICKINISEELNKGKHSYFLSDLVDPSINNKKDIEIHDASYLTGENEKILLDNNWNETTKGKKAKYYRKIEKDPDSDQYVMKDYFMNDTLQGVSYYSSLNPEIIDGRYLVYYENSNIRVEGYFKHRLKDGEWAYWSADGQIDSLIWYKDGIKQSTIYGR